MAEKSTHDATHRPPAKITASFPEDQDAPDASIIVGFGGNHEDVRLLLCAIAARLVEEHILTWEDVAIVAVRGAIAGRKLKSFV